MYSQLISVRVTITY